MEIISHQREGTILTERDRKIKDEHGKVVGFLVNGRVLALTDLYTKALDNVWRAAPEQQLTLGLPDEPEDT